MRIEIVKMELKTKKKRTREDFGISEIEMPYGGGKGWVRRGNGV